MKKSILPLLFILVVITSFAQQGVVNGYYVKAINAIVLQGDTFMFDTPTADGQIISRVNGKWTNISGASYTLIDSLIFRSSNGYLRWYIGGSAQDSTLFDGRYAIASEYMSKAIYDTASIGEQVVGISSSQILNNKTLVLPVISNYTNATHNHTTNATGGTLITDNITQGITNLYSQWTKSGSNIYRNTGNVGIGTSTPQTKLDVTGTTRTQIVEITNSIIFDNLSVTDIVTGTNNNNKFVTQGYVDDAISVGGGYTDEIAQDAIGYILDNGTIGDIDFVYDDFAPLISATVQDDSHTHTSSTVSGLTTADFTSQNVSQWNNDANYAKLGSSQTFTLSNTFTNAVTNFGNINTGFSGIKISAQTNPSIHFINSLSEKLLYRDGNDLRWDAASPGRIIYHSGNANLSTVNWAASNLNATGTVTATGGNSTQWNTAYGWGNHASAGYLTTEVDGSTTNEIQTLTKDSTTTTVGISISGGNRIAFSKGISTNTYTVLEGNVTDRNIDVTLANFTPALGNIITVIPDEAITTGDTITLSVNSGEPVAILDYYTHDSEYALDLVYIDDYWGLLGKKAEEYSVSGDNTGDQDLTPYLKKDDEYSTYSSNGITLTNVNFDDLSDSTLVPKAWVLQQLSLNNNTPQTLVGTSPYWNTLNGLNGIITLSSATTITMANLLPGQHGMLTVNNGGSTSYLITFAGYTFKIHNSIRNSANAVLVSGSTTTDLFSWYYDGTTVLINGGLNFN